MVVRHLIEDIWLTDPPYLVTLYKDETPVKQLGFFHLDQYQASCGVTYELKKLVFRETDEEYERYYADVAGYEFRYNPDKGYYENT
jgi:hypothetical protein